MVCNRKVERLTKVKIPLLMRNFKPAFTFIVFVLSLQNYVFAQSPSIVWEKALGGTKNDNANAIVPTSDGGFIVVGSSHSTNGDVSNHHGSDYSSDYWVVKLSATGDIAWEKSLGGTGPDVANAVLQTSDGGYLIAGQTSSADGDVTTSSTAQRVWLVKLDPSGNLSWQKEYANGFTANSLIESADSHYILAGSASTGALPDFQGITDFWIAKIDNTGTLVWEKSLGGSDRDVAYAVTLASDGGYVLTGHTFSNDGNVSGNHGNVDVWVVKLDDSGTLDWQKCLGGTKDETAYAIRQTTDGGYILTGETGSDDGDVSGNHGINLDYWVVKLAANGTLQWQKCLGGNGTDKGYDIQQTADGGYIVAGLAGSTNDGDVSGNHGYNSDAWIVKLNSMGSIEWQSCYGGTGFEKANAIYETAAGEYIFAGMTFNSTDGDVSANRGAEDFWVVKLAETPVSIADQTRSQPVKMYPNPVRDRLYIETETMVQVVVSDMTGKLLLTQKLEKGEMDLSHLSAGIYFVSVYDQEQLLHHCKLVKQ